MAWLADDEDFPFIVERALPRAEHIRTSTVANSGVEQCEESSDGSQRSSSSHSSFFASESRAPTETSIRRPQAYSRASMSSGDSRVDSQGADSSLDYLIQENRESHRQLFTPQERELLDNARRIERHHAAMTRENEPEEVRRRREAHRHAVRRREADRRERRIRSRTDEVAPFDDGQSERQSRRQRSRGDFESVFSAETTETSVPSTLLSSDVY